MKQCEQNISLNCPTGGNCKVHLLSKRSACRFCRFKKCLAAGMRKDYKRSRKCEDHEIVTDYSNNGNGITKFDNNNEKENVSKYQDILKTLLGTFTKTNFGANFNGNHYDSGVWNDGGNQMNNSCSENLRFGSWIF